MRLNAVCTVSVVVVGVMLSGGRSDAQTGVVPMVDGGTYAYTGDDGPGFWNKYSAECAPSATGRQSPIDISDVVEEPALQPLDIILPRNRVLLRNTGSTILGEPRAGGLLTLDGSAYSLLQFHFHTLAEHTVAGKRGAMELHLVFQDSRNHLAVIGVIYEIGRQNLFLQRLIDAGLPEQTSTPPVPVTNVNLEQALTDVARYYRYSGSLTTPKCNEGVKWVLLRQWDELSSEQFERFRRILGNDFRPLQRRNDRPIYGAGGKRAADGGLGAASTGQER